MVGTFKPASPLVSPTSFAWRPAQESAATYKVRLQNNFYVVVHVFVVYETALEVRVEDSKHGPQHFYQWCVRGAMGASSWPHIPLRRSGLGVLAPRSSRARSSSNRRAGYNRRQ